MNIFFFHPSAFRLHPFRVPLAQQGGLTRTGRGGDQGQPVFQTLIESFKQARAGNQATGLRLGHVEFGAQDGRFHGAKYTITGLTLLIGAIQLWHGSKT